MSCYVVSPQHLQFIVHAAVQLGVVASQVATETLRMLADSNRRSVAIATNTLKSDPPRASELTYNVQAIPLRYRLSTVNPVAVLKSLDRFEYQLCDDPEFDASDAAKLIDALRRRAIRELPDYGDVAYTFE